MNENVCFGGEKVLMKILASSHERAVKMINVKMNIG